MLVKDVCEEVLIEPPSHEDLEATLERDPAEASVRVKVNEAKSPDPCPVGSLLFALVSLNDPRAIDAILNALQSSWDPLKAGPNSGALSYFHYKQHILESGALLVMRADTEIDQLIVQDLLENARTEQSDCHEGLDSVVNATAFLAAKRLGAAIADKSAHGWWLNFPARKRSGA